MTIKTLEQTRSSSQFSPARETRSDSDIMADVRCVLQEDAILSATADQIDAHVNTGNVYLDGYVPTHSHKVRAETDVRQVQGIRQVENNLIADPDLEVLVTQKIAQDARLCTYSIFVHSTIGIIRLDGQVDQVDLAEEAEYCAASVPNVRAVVNCIQSPDAANRQPERVLMPEIGQAVYASDGLLGQVERVVLNANTRRVTAIVVSACFYQRDSKLQRQILIPIESMRNVNASGVELDMTVNETDLCPDFDPTKFVMPDPNS